MKDSHQPRSLLLGCCYCKQTKVEKQKKVISSISKYVREEEEMFGIEQIVKSCQRRTAEDLKVKQRGQSLQEKDERL